MNEIINYYIKSLSSASKSLKKKSILVEKPWALIDNDGEIQKLIFRKDKGLVLSKNGVVTEGSWEYYPDARSLFIDRGTDKLLLNEQYIDENVMILKIDGTGNEFYAMANENTIPDYDIPKYLHSINCKIFAMRSIPLLNSKTLQIPNSPEIDSKICLLDEEYMPQDLSDGVYITKDKSETIYIENGKIKNHKKTYFLNF